MRQFVYKQTKTGGHCYYIIGLTSFVIVTPSTRIVSWTKETTEV